jgi:hypothetical protein
VTLGLSLAVLMAWLISKGLRLLKFGIFFRITSWVLLLSAASLWTTAFVRLINDNILPGFIEPIWDSSKWMQVQSWYGSLLHNFLGYNPRPSLLEVLAYVFFWLSVWFISSSPFKASARKSAFVSGASMLAILAVVLGLFLFSKPAQAVEYEELEVYGAQLASRHELELENASSMSSDDSSDITNKIFRSTFEFNYGLSDKWEVTAYLDYTKPAEDNLEYTAFRTHARTAFAEKGEWPVDVGAYIEAEFPRNFRAKDMGLEFRPILEKDFSRWTLRLNPSVDLSHVAQVVGDNTQTFDADGDELGTTSQTLTADKIWTVSYGASASVAYNWNDRLRPHVDYFVGINDNTALLLPSLDFKIGRELKAQVGFGYGLTPNTENRLILTRIEYEIFL